MFKDNLFNKIEEKTSINKETILNLANKLQQNKNKEKKTIREVINDISKLTGKEVSKEKEDKIVNTILKDQVPKNIDKMF